MDNISNASSDPAADADAAVSAAAAGDIKKLTCLFEKNPELQNKADSKGLTPLGAAAANGKSEAVHFLLNRGADKKGMLEWAREQENNECAAVILAWDYLDRLYESNSIWKKHKISEAYCDICTARITEDDSIMLSFDEVFSCTDYTDRISEQAVKNYPGQLQNKSREEILKTLRDQIEETSITGKYFICDKCLERFFIPAVFGKSRLSVYEIINSKYE